MDSTAGYTCTVVIESTAGDTCTAANDGTAEDNCILLFLRKIKL